MRRVALLSVVAGGILALGLLHTPPVRARLLRAAIDWLRADLGVVATVDSAAYNLLTLQLTLGPTTLAAAGADTPFLSFNRAVIDLPWSIVIGGLAVESIAIERPVVTIRRDAADRTNLPAAAGTPLRQSETPDPTAAVKVDAVAIRHLDLRYTDLVTGITADGRDLSLALEDAGFEASRGRLWMDGAIVIATPGRTTTVTHLESAVSFDGETLALEAFVVEAREGRLRVDAEVDLLADAPRVTARYEGQVDLAPLAAWTDSDLGLTGPASVSGTVEGPVAAAAVGLDLRADDVVWRDRRGLAVELGARLTPTTAAIDWLRLRDRGGALDARAVIGLADDASSTAEITWSRLDLAGLVRTASPAAPRFDARAAGRFTARWRGTSLDGASATLTTDIAPDGGLATAGPGVAARVAATLHEGRWTADLDRLAVGPARFTGAAAGRVSADDLAATTLTARLRGEVNDVPALVATLAAAGIPVATPLTAGRATVELEVRGTVAAPTARAKLDATDLIAAGSGPGTFSMSATLDGGRLAVNAADVVLGDNHVQSQFDVDVASGRIAGTLAADLRDVAALAAMAAPDVRPDGALTMRAVLGGSLGDPAATITGRATSLRAAGQRLDDVQFSASLSHGVVDVQRFDAAQGSGRLRASGSYCLDSGRYGFTISGRDLSVQPTTTVDTALPLSASFDVEARGQGTLDAPGGEGTLMARDVTWDGYHVGSARLEATVAGQRVELRVEVPSLAVGFDAAATRAAPRAFQATVRAVGARLDALTRAGGPAAADEDNGPAAPVTGTVAAVLTASGDLDAPAEATVDLDVRLADVSVAATPLMLAGPARLRYEAGRLTVERVEARTGATTLAIGGSFGGDGSGEALTMTLHGQAADAVPFARLVPGLEGLDASGSVDMQVTASGTIDAPRLAATAGASALRVSLPELPPVTDGTLQASLADGLVTLTAFTATWQGATLTAEGRAPATLLGDQLPASYRRSLPALPNLASATVRLDALSAQVAAPFVAPGTLDQIAVDASVRVDLTATGPSAEALDATVVFDRASLVLAGQPLEQTTPTTVTFADGRVRVEAWEWAGGDSTLTVTGGATLRGESAEVDAAVTGALDLRIIQAVAPDVIAGGRARLDVRARGPLADIAFDGELVVAGGEVALREPRIALTDLTGRIELARDRVRLVDLRAAANGGTLQARGEVALDTLQPVGGTVSIQGRALALEVPDDLRSELDLDLTLDLAADDPELAGRVTVLRGSYREPVSLANQLLAGVEVAPVDPAEPGLLDRLRLDVAVVSEEAIAVDNNYGRLDIGTDLKVIGTAARPSLAGRMAVAEGGAIFLAGQTWSVERGTVDFTNPAVIEPSLNLLLTTRVQQYDVRLSVTGTPTLLEANLSSPDGISEADAVSLLLTGALADQQTVAQRDIARGQLVLLLSGELLGFAGRAVGLNSAQVGRGLGAAGSSFDLLATDSDPATRLTLSKRLRRDVEVVFSRSLRNANDITWIAIYRPLRSVELRTTTLDDNARSYEFRHEVTVGGPPSPTVTAPRRESPRVAAVAITGTRDIAVDDLRRRLHLSAGDRFDFYRWQQDRDRLAEFYHQRGHFEVRVRATREPVTDRDGASAVHLAYAIDPGPETLVVVDGPALPAEVIDDVRDSWTHAVFDGFVRDDTAAMVRHALAEDGHLQARVDVEMHETPARATKTLVLHVDPGPRFGDRQLRFAGQRALTADDLTDVLDARRLRTAAWLRPGEAESALVAHYRSLGYLRARVDIGTPRFSGTTAMLPVTVDEGPQHLIGTVDIRGVAAQSLDEVRRRFGIAAGDVYLPAALEAARREVEIAYAARGFNAMRATLTGRVDDVAPAVTIALEVREGPQQVIRDVVVRGRTRTSPGTVAAAVDLDPGALADRADTYRAQQRLYDTGVFRRADVELEPLGPAGADGVQPVRAAVTLEEVPPYRLRYGLRFTDGTAPVEADRTPRLGAVVDLLRRNLFGRAFTAGIAGQLEADRRLARAVFSAPRLFGLPVTSSLFLTRSRQELNPAGALPFIRDGAEMVAEQRFNPRSDLTVAYNYRFLRTHAFPSGDDADDLFDLRVDVARLTGNVAWDTRDDPFNPRRGGLLSSGIEFATPSLGSDIRFMKLVLQQYRFVPAGPVVLASAVRLGTAWAFDRPLLFTERYFAGGGTSVRGYAEDGLGGADVFGDPVGGPNSFILNQEVRFPIYKWAHGVGFVDAGNVFDRAGDIRLGDLAYGTGLGLRFDTPFGLARIDFAVPLTDRRRQPAGRWYFSLGHAF